MEPFNQHSIDGITAVVNAFDALDGVMQRETA